MNITINGKQLKKTTIALLIFLGSGGIATQFTWVNNHISKYPHMAALGTFLIGFLTLLHDPFIQKILFQQQQDLPGGGTADSKISMPAGEPIPPGGVGAILTSSTDSVPEAQTAEPEKPASPLPPKQ